MGYFAVLSDKPSDITVVRCHLNLWVLPGLLWRRVFYFDAGIGLRFGVGSDTAARTFKLALPFGVEEGGHLDISSHLLSNSDTAMLVFGQKVRVTRDGTAGELRYDNRKTKARKRVVYAVHPKQVVTPTTGSAAAAETSTTTAAVGMTGEASLENVDDDELYEEEETLKVVRTTLKREESLSSENASMYSVTVPPADADAEVYIRLRFRVSDAARMWLSRSAGSLLDFRVADVREVVAQQAWSELTEQVVPIKKLNAFVIIPSDLQARAASPQPKYVRSLEGSLWEDYLRRRIAFFADNKLFIYYWRASNIDDKEPFRLFLDLQSAPASVWFGVLAGLIAGLLWPGVFRLGEELLSHKLTYSTPAWILAALSAFGISKVALPKLGTWLYGSIRNIRALRGFAMRAEDLVYGWRLKGPGK